MSYCTEGPGHGLPPTLAKRRTCKMTKNCHHILYVCSIAPKTFFRKSLSRWWAIFYYCAPGFASRYELVMLHTIRVSRAIFKHCVPWRSCFWGHVRIWYHRDPILWMVTSNSRWGSWPYSFHSRRKICCHYSHLIRTSWKRQKFLKGWCQNKGSIDAWCWNSIWWGDKV